MRMQALRALGSVLCSLQRGYEAEQLHRAALRELEEGDVSTSSTAVAICKQGLAEAIMAERPRWRRKEDAAEAENLLREALATFQQAPMEPSLIADLHAVLAISLRVQIRFEEAVLVLEEACSALEKIPDAFGELQRDVRAEQFMGSALENWEHVEHVPSKMDPFGFIDARAFLVKNLFHQGKQDEGRQVLRKLQEDVVADSRRPYAEKARWSAIDRIISVGLKAESFEMCHMVMQHLQHPQNQWAYHKLGECYAELGMALFELDHEEEACAALRRGMEFLPLAGDTDWDVMLLCLNGCSAVFSLDEARQEEAEQMMYEGLRLISEGYTSKNFYAKNRWRDSLVRLFFKQGNHMKAAELLRDVVQEQKRSPQPNGSEVWQYRLGEALHLAGDYEEEEKVLWDAAKSLASLQEVGEDSEAHIVLLGDVYHAIAGLVCARGKLEEATELLRNAVIVTHAKLGMDHDMSKILQDRLAEVMYVKLQGCGGFDPDFNFYREHPVR
ncbi:hypothetical protein COCSUDRAFT_42811 [Coccomyxa subellipsoidea C-169]|uniref:TPR-like protein n=1 Tax=Coccomyxa subellipsoidea (strain C-169) TaxID=574566 RepID=I0YTN1_COCSC|nr:hypothetical protein COCSUDRAFT_42811 [Coccomyxa subellipsoidea C-169]EIE21750.1 hypothetical protein COCSUDRAFT_42811 [Coccomyxa subellipsoidea C-169]|eukprot:XP_005646294.1 hypothetical protein COCSUDRAFT_42811 [Coccomyxa subellipsoidea C-169]